MRPAETLRIPADLHNVLVWFGVKFYPTNQQYLNLLTEIVLLEAGSRAILGEDYLGY